MGKYAKYEFVISGSWEDPTTGETKTFSIEISGSWSVANVSETYAEVELEFATLKTVGDLPPGYVPPSPYTTRWDFEKSTDPFYTTPTDLEQVAVVEERVDVAPGRVDCYKVLSPPHYAVGMEKFEAYYDRESLILVRLTMEVRS